MLSTRRSLLNFGSFVTSKGIAVLLFLVGVHYFVLNAGPADYGAVNLILVLYTYLWIADFGIGYAINLRIGRALGQAGHGHLPPGSRVAEAVSTALPFYLLLGIGIAAAGAALSEPLAVGLFDAAGYAELVTWTALAAPLVMLSALSNAVLRAHDQVYLVNATQLFLDVWRAGALVLCSNGPEPAVAVGQAFFFGALGRMCIDALLLVRTAGWRSLVPIWSPRALAIDLRTGVPTMGSLVISSLFYSIDRIAAAKSFALQGLAIYSLAADLHTKAYFLVWAFNATLYQPLVATHARGEATRRLVAMNVGGALLIALLYYVPLAVFSEPLIAIWIDAPSAAAATPLVWAMLPGSVAYLLGSSLENTLLKARGIVFQPMLVHAAMLLALVLGLAMLPRWYGLAGVGWAHSLANGVFLLGIVLLVTWRGRPR